MATYKGRFNELKRVARPIAEYAQWLAECPGTSGLSDSDGLHFVPDSNDYIHHLTIGDLRRLKEAL